MCRSAGRRPSKNAEEEGERMPLLNVKLIEGLFTEQQKRQIIEKLTETMVSIEGENMRGVTWCVVEEVKSGDWGIGGKALTTQDVRRLAEGAPARLRPAGGSARASRGLPNPRFRLVGRLPDLLRAAADSLLCDTGREGRLFGHR